MLDQRTSQAAESTSAAEILTPVRSIFRAVTTTVVPEAASLDAFEWTKLETLVGETLSSRPVSEQRQLQLFLRLIDWLPVVRYGRRFTALDANHRRCVLSYLQDHRLVLIRTGFWGLRTLALLGYYGRAQAAQAIGYTPNFRGWGALRPPEQPSNGQTRGEAL